MLNEYLFIYFFILGIFLISINSKVVSTSKGITALKNVILSLGIIMMCASVGFFLFKWKCNCDGKLQDLDMNIYLAFVFALGVAIIIISSILINSLRKQIPKGDTKPLIMLLVSASISVVVVGGFFFLRKKINIA